VLSWSGVGNGARGRGIVRRPGGRGGRGIGRGGVLEDLLPLRTGLHFQHKINLQMGDPRRVANVLI
jgi:hypothetical protein